MFGVFFISGDRILFKLTESIETGPEQICGITGKFEQSLP